MTNTDCIACKHSGYLTFSGCKLGIDPSKVFKRYYDVKMGKIAEERCPRFELSKLSENHVWGVEE